MLPLTSSQAVAEIVALARRYHLTPDDIAAALQATPDSAADPAGKNISQIMVRILSYIGGLLVFAGIGIYTGMEWISMTGVERLLVTLGAGIVALILSVACLKDRRYERATTPMLLLAGLLEPTGMLVFLHEYFPPSPHPELAVSLVFLVLSAQQIALLNYYGRTTMALLAIFFGFTGVEAMLYWLHADLAFTGVVLSFAGLCLVQALAKSSHRVLAPWLFVAFGVSMIENLFPLLLSHHINWLYVVIGGGLATAVIMRCLAVFVTPHPVVLFFAIVPYLSFLLAALDRLHMASSLILLVISGAGCAIAYGLRNGLHRELTPILYLIYAGMMSAGVYNLLRNTPFDVLMIGFGALMMYVSVVLASRMLLTVSVFSLLGYLTYFTSHYFAHVVGWPIALIILGLVLILISVKAVKLGQKISQTS